MVNQFLLTSGADTYALFFQTKCGLGDLRVCQTWYWIVVRRSVESYRSSLIGLLDKKFRNYYMHWCLHPSWNVQVGY